MQLSYIAHRARATRRIDILPPRCKDRAIAARPSRARDAGPLREATALIAGIVCYCAGIVLAALHGPHAAALTLRCLGRLALLVFAALRRSLSVWMFVAMVVGA